MAQIAYRANLSAATYPMTIADGGRTVIMPGPDNNYDRRVDPTGEQKNAGIPQALYMENVMPTVNGYQSLTLWSPSDPMAVPPGEFVGSVSEIKTLAGSPATVQTVPLFQLNSGTLLTNARGTGAVSVIGTYPAFTAKFSSATVRGICYLYNSTTRLLYTVTGTAPVVLTEVTASVTPLNFFTTNGIDCIVGSSNYLIALAGNTVYYSSTTTPIDFVSSLVSGAGQTSLSDLDGTALWAKETQAGFYVYGNKNIVYAQYTGNSRYPWKFTSVRNSNGINPSTAVLFKASQLFGEVDTSGHYVLENLNQIKFIQGGEAVSVAAEVNEFLNKTVVQETFNYSTNTFTAQQLYTNISQIYVWLNRYVVVSVNGSGGSTFAGAVPFSHCIVYDSLLQRYGKLKIPHGGVFAAEISNGPNAIIRPALAFVEGLTNTIRYISFDIYTTAASGYTSETPASVLVLGKFQYVRSRKIQLHEVQVEGPQNSAVTASPNFSCALLPSQNGRTFDTPITPYQVSNTGGLAIYNCHNTAQNHTLVFKGAFELSSLQLKFSPRGDT